MATNVDLTLGVNLQIGSVPLALQAEVSTGPDESVYTFNGCVQDASINLGSFMSFVGQQFGVDVQLPPELNLQAEIDYVAGQITYTKPQSGSATTEIGVAAKFDLQYNGGSVVTLTFYADTIITAGSTEKTYVVGGAIDTDLKFSNLPLIGNIPVLRDYTLKHIGFSYTNADPSADGEDVQFNIPKVDTSENPLYTRSDPDAKNSKAYSIDTSGDATTFSLSQKGFAFTAGLMKEDSDAAEQNFSLPMALPAAPPSQGPASYYNSGGDVQTSPPASPVHWVNVNKSFGPVNLRKIGLNYNQGEATFGLSAGFSLGAFALDLEGLTITFPLPLPGMPAGDTVSFDLDGLGMDFQKGSLAIGGAFLKAVENNITSYYGQVVVNAGTLGFKALGGYSPAQNGNPSSFFLYANLQAPLGGPPFLYVTGLAFGFGINRTLILPTIETLPGYLLLPQNAPAQGSSPSSTMSSVMPKMQAIFQDAPGQYWVAAGIQFTSFEMISAFALLTVSFGVDTQIGILGTCAITLPKGASSPLAYIEIDMVASFTPSSGALAVLGVISPSSYVWGDYVKLSGGFAFCTWFSGDHQGDFVVSIGGYNPAYSSKPSWYPDVPRIGMSFGLGPFQATGSAYLALTPAMFMAGMQFTATWSAGPISAWFSAGVDFLVTWAPFTYLANAYVNVGCSVDLGLFTVHAHIGAGLQVWGPSFGGQADVDLDVCSFTIHFGSSAPDTLPVSWQNIEQNFLPPPVAPSEEKLKRVKPGVKGKLLKDPVARTANVTASVGKPGLQETDVQSQDGENWDWIVDPNQFVITTAATIPANAANWVNGPGKLTAIKNDPTQFPVVGVSTPVLPGLQLPAGASTFSPTQVWNPTLHVKPMNLQNVQVVHNIQLCKRVNDDPVGVFSNYITAVAVEPVLSGSVAALWSDPAVANSANADTLLPDTLTGFRIMPLTRTPSLVNAVPLITLLYARGNQTTFTYTGQQPDPNYTVTFTIDASENMNIIVAGNASKTLVNTNYILSSLVDSWVTTQRNAMIGDLVANGFPGLPSKPNLNVMGTMEALTDWPMAGLLGQTIQS